MGIFKDRSNYLKQLAIDNKLIAHTRNINGEVRNSFFRMNDNEEFLAALVNYAHSPFVIHFGFDGRYTANKNLVSKRVLSNALAFLVKVDNVSDMDAVEDAYDVAFEAMEQFVSKMIYQFDTDGSCSPFSNIDPSRFNFQTYEMNGNLHGWLLNFNDEKYADEVYQFDATKWFE
jgi:hypothetical protein